MVFLIAKISIWMVMVLRMTKTQTRAAVLLFIIQMTASKTGT